MIKKNVKIIYAIFVLFLSVACHPKNKNCSSNSHSGLTIINKSSKNIRYDIYWNYPDTNIGNYNIYLGSNLVLSKNDSTIRGAGPTLCWETLFANNKKEYLYIFDNDTLAVLSWEIIKKTNRGLLKRIEFDSLSLENTNYRIVYP